MSVRGTTTAPTATGEYEIEFSELISAHRRELLVHCARMTRSGADSEDLVQETLLRAWRGREGFEGRAGQASLRSWLYRIATNVCLDAQHRRRLRLVPISDPADGLDWQEVLPSPDPGPQDQMVARETIERALEATKRLPPRQRTVLIMRDVIGLTARDTASRLGVSIPSANSLLQRARVGLRAQLAEEATARSVSPPT
jgi:RNA polymerase sigma-70 factor (ECF subfamily)